jgi:fucose permease
MLKRLQFDSDDLGLALVLWICTLPLTALIVIPKFSLKTGLITALAVALVFVFICWGTFQPSIYKGPNR